MLKSLAMDFANMADMSFTVFAFFSNFPTVKPWTMGLMTAENFAFVNDFPCCAAEMRATSGKVSMIALKIVGLVMRSCKPSSARASMNAATYALVTEKMECAVGVLKTGSTVLNARLKVTREILPFCRAAELIKPMSELDGSSE